MDRQSAIMGWFQSMFGDIQVQRQNPLVLEMLHEYRKAWDAMGAEPGPALHKTEISVAFV